MAKQQPELKQMMHGDITNLREHQDPKRSGQVGFELVDQVNGNQVTSGVLWYSAMMAKHRPHFEEHVLPALEAVLAHSRQQAAQTTVEVQAPAQPLPSA